MPIHQLPLSALPSVRQLRAFVAVCHLGGASAAAERLAITQPAVTMLLRELEDRLGLKLFDRTGRHLKMTAAAHEALVHAEQVLADLDRLAWSMGELAQGRRGSLSVAATATVAQSIFPRAMQVLHRTHPDIQVRLCEVAPEAFVDTLRASRVDLGIGILEAPVPGLAEEVVMRDTLVAASLPSSALQAHGPLRWDELAAHPVITVRSGYGVRHQIDEAAARAGVTLQITQEVSLLSTALALAAHGLGVALVPGSLAGAAAAATLLVRPMADPAVERAVAIVAVKAKAHSPAAQAFCAAVRETCDALSEVGRADCI